MPAYVFDGFAAFSPRPTPLSDSSFLDTTFVSVEGDVLERVFGLFAILSGSFYLSEVARVTDDALGTTWSNACKRLEEAEALLPRRP